MAKYEYVCKTECVRTDFEDIIGFPGPKRIHEGQVVNSHRKINSPKFELIRYEPDPPKEEEEPKSKAKSAAKTDKE